MPPRWLLVVIFVNGFPRGSVAYRGGLRLTINSLYFKVYEKAVIDHRAKNVIEAGTRKKYMTICVQMSVSTQQANLLLHVDLFYLKPASQNWQACKTVRTVGTQMLWRSPPGRQETAGYSPFLVITSAKTVYDLSDKHMTSWTVM